MAKIYIKFESAVIKEMKLSQDVTTFGRKPGNDIVIDHPAISSFHGKIIKEGNDFFVEDLNSTNGTTLNGRKVSKNKLSNKDNIRIAKHVIEFLVDDNEKIPGAKPPEAPEGMAAASAPAQAAPPPPPPPKPEVKPEPKPDPEPKPQPKAEAPAPAPAPAKPEPKPVEKPDLNAQKEMLRQGLGLAPKEEIKKPEESPLGILKVIAGGVNGQNEVTLKSMVTYIGTSDQAAIKIKGFLAPDLAAAISRKPEGYYLKAVKSGYPKVNSNPVKDQVLLEVGAQIECGATTMIFRLMDGKKKS